MDCEPAAGQAPNGKPGAGRSYPLGYSEAEFARLERQGAFFRDITDDALRRAGLAPGMRVLDLGCGVGDVALAAGALVGPFGEVLGIDRSIDVVARARARAAAAKLPQVRFAVAAVETFTTIQSFDAIIGRLVLMYLPDPAEALRRLCEHLRPCGVVAFQEMAMPLARSVPAGPLFNRAHAWILDTFARAGLEYDMGSKLQATFLAAGLPQPQMIQSGRVEGGCHSGVYDYMADTLRSLLPTMERLGIASTAEVAIDDLGERLRREAVALGACIMPPPLVSAWARVPG